MLIYFLKLLVVIVQPLFSADLKNRVPSYVVTEIASFESTVISQPDN
ncbi:MAG: hypothetical protein V7K58_31640 [Nostoc sp.]